MFGGTEGANHDSTSLLILFIPKEITSSNVLMQFIIRKAQENPAMINRAGYESAHQQPVQSQLVNFRHFNQIPPELRLMVWKERAILELPRILKFEARSDLATTFDINLFSRPNPLLAVCEESYIVSRDATSARNIFKNPGIGVLAASQQFEMIHFWTSYKVGHLERFERVIGTYCAAKVHSLILEMELSVFQTPIFYRMCQLFPKLQCIIFVFREANNPSNGIGGHMVYTNQYDPTADTRLRYNREAALQTILFCLKMQLETRNMKIVHPKIVYLDPVRAEVQEN